MYRDARKARLDIEHTRALSSRPCIAPTFSSLAAPSALLVGGFCAWEEEGAPSSAALTRRAAPPMYAMGGAASFQPRPLPRSHRSRARTRLGGRTFTFTAARDPCLDTFIVPEFATTARTRVHRTIVTRRRRQSIRTTTTRRMRRLCRRRMAPRRALSLKRTVSHDVG